MSSLERLFIALGQALAKIGTVPNKVSAKEDVLIVREATGVKTICLIRCGADDDQPSIEWVRDRRANGGPRKVVREEWKPLPWADASVRAGTIEQLKQVELKASALRALLQSDQLSEADFLLHVEALSEQIGQLAELPTRIQPVPADHAVESTLRAS